MKIRPKQEEMKGDFHADRQKQRQKGKRQRQKGKRQRHFDGFCDFAQNDKQRQEEKGKGISMDSAI
jgi:hypothetical protein